MGKIIKNFIFIYILIFQNYCLSQTIIEGSVTDLETFHSVYASVVYADGNTVGRGRYWDSSCTDTGGRGVTIVV